MANSISPIQSSPFAGLGSAELQVTTTGLYTLEFKSFLPYLAAGSPPQSVSPSAEITDATLAADSSGSRNDTYYTFWTAGDVKGYYVWFNINSAGTDPAIANMTGIEVAGATDATAATLATAARAAITASTYVTEGWGTVGGATTHVITTNKQYGQSTNAANGAGGASAGASFSITQGSYGTPAASGLTAKIIVDDVVVAQFGNPSPTQPVLGGSATFAATANDVVELELSSLSDADAALNAVKTVVNLYQGQ